MANGTQPLGYTPEELDAFDAKQSQSTQPTTARQVGYTPEELDAFDARQPKSSYTPEELDAFDAQQPAYPSAPNVESLPTSHALTKAPIGVGESLRLRAQAQSGAPETTLSAVARGVGLGIPPIVDAFQERSLQKLARGEKASPAVAGIDLPFMRGPIDEWEATEGARIADPVAREQAKTAYVQTLASENLKERLRNKADAQAELSSRERTLPAKIIGGGIENAGYTAAFMLNKRLPGFPVAVSAARRFGELTSDKLALTPQGDIAVTAKADEMGTKAVGKAIAGGAAEFAVEKFGGDALNKLTGGAFRKLGGGAIISAVKRTPVIGNALKTFANLGKVTGIQGVPGEVFEEAVQDVIDIGAGVGLRGAEKTDTDALQRTAQALQDFDTKEVVLAMLLQQGAQGGVASAKAFNQYVEQGNRMDKLLNVFGADTAGMSQAEKRTVLKAIQTNIPPDRAQRIIAKLGARAQQAYQQVTDKTEQGFRADTPEGVLNAKASYAQDVAQRVAGKVPVEAFDTEADLVAAYPAIAQAATYKPGDVPAVYHDGKMLIVLDQNEKPADIVSSVLHELGGHAAIDAMPQAEVKAMLSQLGGTAYRDALAQKKAMVGEAQEAAASRIAELEPLKATDPTAYAAGVAEAQNALNAATAQAETLAPEEALAYMRENSGANPSAYQRAVAVVRKHLRKVMPTLKFSDAEVEVFFRDAAKAVRGEGGAFTRMPTAATDNALPATATEAPLPTTGEPQATAANIPAPVQAAPEAAPVAAEVPVLAQPISAVPSVQTDSGAVAVTEAAAVPASATPQPPQVDGNVGVPEAPPSVSRNPTWSELDARQKEVVRGVVDKEVADLLQVKRDGGAVQNMAGEQTVTQRTKDAIRQRVIERYYGRERRLLTPEQRAMADAAVPEVPQVDTLRPVAEKVAPPATAPSATVAPAATAQQPEVGLQPPAAAPSRKRKFGEKPQAKTAAPAVPAWQQTQAEYVANGGTAKAHKSEVGRAIRAGETVPEAVMAAYPDVAAKVAKSAAAKNLTAADITTPELMTPEAYKATFFGGRTDRMTGDPFPPEWVRYDDNGDSIGKWMDLLERDKKLMGKRSGKDILALSGTTIGVSGGAHKWVVEAAAKEQAPLNAAAVDAYGIMLQDGYVREGDRYVFKPTTKETPNATKAVGEQGGVQVERARNGEERQAREAGGRGGVPGSAQGEGEVDDLAAVAEREERIAKAAKQRAARKAERGTARFRRNVSPAQDAEYAAAVERGDVATAQWMVDDAARAAGYTVGPVWHGSKSKPFYVFDAEQGQGQFYFTNRESVADEYVFDPDGPYVSSSSDLYKDHVRRFFLKMENPAIEDRKGETWFGAGTTYKPKPVWDRIYDKGMIWHDDQIQEAFNNDYYRKNKMFPSVAVSISEDPATAQQAMTDEFERFKNERFDNTTKATDTKKTRDASDDYRSEGYDGVIFKNIVDSVWSRSSSDVYVVFKPSDIKSADAITRDDAGRVIPLSERFNEATPDIRFRRNANPQTATPEFRKWFGDSKVVDADGEPMVVYHGTASDFGVFRTSRSGELGSGIYFSDNPKEASGYVNTNARGGDGQNVMPVYLSIKNPLVISSADQLWSEVGNVPDDKVIDALSAKGYDGVMFKRPLQKWVDGKGVVDLGEMQTHIVAFSPTQIKSATGNIGTFDADNPDIRFRRRTRALPSTDAEARRQQAAVERVYADTLTPTTLDAMAKDGRDSYDKNPQEAELALMAGTTPTGRIEDDARRMARDKIAVDSVTRKATADGNDVGKAQSAMLGVWQWYRRGTEAARALRLRFDPVDTPEARRAMIDRMLYAPTAQDTIRLERAKDMAEQKDALQDSAKRALRTLKMLKEMGLDYTKFTNEELMDSVKMNRVMTEIATKRASLGDKIHEWWRNSILSAPTTQIVNTLGNAGNAGLEAFIQRPTEALINNFVKSPDAATANSVRAMYKAITPSFNNAWKNAVNAWSSERPVTGPGGTKLEESNAAIGGMKGKIIRVPQRFMTATDEFFKTIFMSMLTADYATRQFDQRVKDGKEKESDRDAYMRASMEVGTDAYMKAWDETLKWSFQQDTGAIASAVSRIRNDPQFGFFIKFVLPFVKTPANIVSTGLRKSPANLLPTLYKLANDKYADKNEAIKAGAEQMVGMAVMAAIWGLTRGDDDDPLNRPRLTGSRTTGASYRPGERESEMRDYPPQSIRFGDKWVSYARLEPFATVLTTMADVMKAWELHKSGRDGDIPRSAFNWVKGTVSDKTFLQGIGDIINIIESGDDNKLAQFGQRIVSGFNPNVVKSVLRAFDPYQRDMRNREQGMEWLKTSGERLAQMTLPAKELAPIARYDIAGRPVEKQGGLTQIVNPFRTQAANRLTKVDVMLKRYNDAQTDADKRWMPAPPQVPEIKLFGRAEPVKVLDSEYAEYQRIAGETAARRLSSMTFNFANPTERDVERVKRTYEDARKLAKRQISAVVRRRVAGERKA